MSAAGERHVIQVSAPAAAIRALAIPQRHLNDFHRASECIASRARYYCTLLAMHADIDHFFVVRVRACA